MSSRLRTNPYGGAVSSNPRWGGAFVFASINRAGHDLSQMQAYARNGRRLTPLLVAQLTVLALAPTQFVYDKRPPVDPDDDQLPVRPPLSVCSRPMLQ